MFERYVWKSKTAAPYTHGASVQRLKSQSRPANFLTRNASSAGIDHAIYVCTITSSVKWL